MSCETICKFNNVDLSLLKCSARHHNILNYGINSLVLKLLPKSYFSL